MWRKQRMTLLEVGAKRELPPYLMLSGLIISLIWIKFCTMYEVNMLLCSIHRYIERKYT